VLIVIAIQCILAVPARLSRSRWVRMSWVLGLLALNVALAELMNVPQARALMDETLESRDPSGKIADVGGLYHKFVWNALLRMAIELTQIA